MLTVPITTKEREAQKREIRALAIQAAATLFANREARGEHGIIGITLAWSRTIETYIEDGIIPTDKD